MIIAWPRFHGTLGHGARGSHATAMRSLLVGNREGLT